MKLTRLRGVLPIAAALFIMLSTLSAVYAELRKGEKAPEFKLLSVDGKMLSLKEIRKDPAKKGTTRVVLLDFWATWCPPCKQEIPHLQKLHEKYGKKGLAVVGVSVDTSGAKVVRPFVKERKLTYTILLDPKGGTQKDYRVRFYPTVYILDKKGIICNVHVGYKPGMEKDLEKEIQALLK
ncbi:MAG TPA: TlpA disulfide reductase family protein [Armatimonadota bacterium]|nr:TlpA disulfide reductase family protein [Armatimonadota bacterium]